MELTIKDIHQAHKRIAPHIHRTPILQSQLLNQMIGCELYFKAENFQKIGAFKARGGCNAVFSMDEASLQKGVITHSSGNHGAALAWAASPAWCPLHRGHARKRSPGKERCSCWLWCHIYNSASQPWRRGKAQCQTYSEQGYTISAPL